MLPIKVTCEKKAGNKDGKEERGNGGDAPPTRSGQKQIVHGHPLSSSLPRLHCWMGRSFLRWLQGEISNIAIAKIVIVLLF